MENLLYFVVLTQAVAVYFLYKIYSISENRLKRAEIYRTNLFGISKLQGTYQIIAIRHGTRKDGVDWASAICISPEEEGSHHIREVPLDQFETFLSAAPSYKDHNENLEMVNTIQESAESITKNTRMMTSVEFRETKLIISSLGDLPDNWDGIAALKVETVPIKAAIRFLHFMNQYNVLVRMSDLDISGTLEGGVELQWSSASASYFRIRFSPIESDPLYFEESSIDDTDLNNVHQDIIDSGYSHCREKVLIKLLQFL